MFTGSAVVTVSISLSINSIEEMIVDLEADSKSLNPLETPNLGTGIKSSTYRIEGQNREYPQYELDRDSTYCLITGYDAVPRMRIIKRWQELEAQVAVVANEEDELDIAFRQAEQMVSQSERMTIQAKQIVAVLKHQKEMRQEIKAIGEKLHGIHRTQSRYKIELVTIGHGIMFAKPAVVTVCSKVTAV